MAPTFVALAVLACNEPTPRRDPALVTERHVEIEEIDEAAGPIEEDELPPPIADQPEASALDQAPPVIAPAAAVDTAYDSDELVEVRRFVYRVHLDVPSLLGEPSGAVETAAAELVIDVGLERVRARFAGPGWPVEAGSEVRLRGDSPGGYVFDERGGRPLLPGELATWFEGGPPRQGPILMARRDPALRGATAPGPGMLVCALLAEWSGEPRDNVMRRCATGAPLSFRVGFWRGERMADVSVQMPRREVRADHVAPPEIPPRAPSRTFLESTALERLAPHTMRPGEEVTPTDPAPAEGLEVENESEARIVVIADGVAIGWVASGATGHFSGLVPGVHDVAAMRPLGAVVMRPREVPLPGRTVLHAARRLPE